MSTTSQRPSWRQRQRPSWLQRTVGWVNERLGNSQDLVTGSQPLVGALPTGPHWRYSTGAVLVYLFLVELVTGLFLMAAYAPSSHTAWESVFYIEHVMLAGSAVRGIHHYATHAMVVVAVLHIASAVFDASYRRPRELAWWLTLALVGVMLVLSQTGYVLVWDQRSLVATGITTRIAGAAPGIGPVLEQLARGGSGFGNATLTRFYTLHVGVLPLVFITLGLWRLKLQQRLAFAPINSASDSSDSPAERIVPGRWFPNQAIRDAIAALITLAVVATLALVLKAPLGPPADNTVSFDAARPEWWFLPVFQMLHFDSISHLVAGHLIPAAAFLSLALLPFVPRRRGLKWVGPTVFLTLLAGAVGLGGFALYQDWFAANDHGRAFRASMEESEVDAARVRELAASGIPLDGAAVLLRHDPKTQGGRLFSQFCSSCHAYEGHDGRGRPLAELAQAPDLGPFGTRGWLRTNLLAFGEQFAPLVNVPGDSPYKEAADEILSGEEGYMLHWSRVNGPILAAADDDLKDVIEYVVYQSGRDDLRPYDMDRVERGQSVYEDGTLSNATEIEACSGCHTLTPREDDELPEIESDEGYPALTGYGGTDWVRRMIRNPASHYGDPNAMPGFETQLTPEQIDMIARWLTHDYD